MPLIRPDVDIAPARAADCGATFWLWMFTTAGRVRWTADTTGVIRLLPGFGGAASPVPANATSIPTAARRGAFMGVRSMLATLRHKVAVPSPLAVDRPTARQG